MILGMWTRAPGGAAWMQKKHVDSKWFFSHNRCLRCRIVQEGDLAICGIGIGLGVYSKKRKHQTEMVGPR